MRHTLALVVLLAACSDSSGPPSQPPVIVKLVVASDTGFWRGAGLQLSTLVTGAITAEGDTIAAQGVAWTVPSGFTQSGDDLTAIREARGALVATIGPVTASIRAAALDDLSTAAGWSATWRCYNSTVHMRGIEHPPIGLDSIIGRQSNGAVTYTETRWSDVMQISMAVDEEIIRFWKDGVTDTVHNRTAIPAMQDTLSVALGTNVGPAARWMKRVAESPIMYRLDAPGTCSGDWVGADGRHDAANPNDGGTAFELRAP